MVGGGFRVCSSKRQPREREVNNAESCLMIQYAYHLGNTLAMVQWYFRGFVRSGFNFQAELMLRRFCGHENSE